MNPQPDPIVGDIIAALVILIVVIYTIKAVLENKTLQLNDNFVIGYIESDPIIINQIHEHKSKKVIVNKKPSFESQQLYLDCIDALVALGMKKREARNKAKFVFSTMNPQPQSIQEFLVIALNMPS
jgi:hypothetical protein